MLIRLSTSLDDRVIAREDQMGVLEAAFVRDSHGRVLYAHPADSRSWWAADSARQFLDAVEAWNEYSNAVARVPENEQLALVDRLRERLQELQVLTHPESVWGVLLEQAEHGLL